MSPPMSNDRLPPPPSYEASTQFALRASALASIAAQAAAVQAAQAAVAQPQPPPRRASPETLPEDPRPIREITIITGNNNNWILSDIKHSLALLLGENTFFDNSIINQRSA